MSNADHIKADHIIEAKLGGIADHVAAAYDKIDAALAEPNYKVVIRNADPKIDDPIPSDRYAVARLTEISEEAMRYLGRGDDADLIGYHERNYDECVRLLHDDDERRRFCDWCRDAYDLTVEQGNEYNPRAAINPNAIRLFTAGFPPAKYAAWTLALDQAHLDNDD